MPETTGHFMRWFSGRRPVKMGTPLAPFYPECHFSVVVDCEQSRPQSSHVAKRVLTISTWEGVAIGSHYGVDTRRLTTVCTDMEGKHGCAVGQPRSGWHSVRIDRLFCRSPVLVPSHLYRNWQPISTVTAFERRESASAVPLHTADLKVIHTICLQGCGQLRHKMR